ncbi:MAG: hypothetical protein KF744_07455 [Taibaiella sp.]|nr:hypothetical protein [Taibaiella sp.]
MQIVFITNCGTRAIRTFHLRRVSSAYPARSKDPAASLHVQQSNAARLMILSDANEPQKDMHNFPPSSPN